MEIDNNSPFTSEYFRNRLYRLQSFCVQKNLDAILLIMGIDGNNDSEHIKLFNWLVRGKNGINLSDTLDSDIYDDLIMVITRHSLNIYCNKKTFKILSLLTALVQNTNYYVITKEDLQDQERSEVIKVTQFYEMIFDKNKVGIPVTKPKKGEKYYGLRNTPKFLIKSIEKWALLQAYALDLVGQGFFTLKHSVTEITKDLKTIYHEYDSFLYSNLFKTKIPQMETYFNESFLVFSKSTLNKRMQVTEAELGMGITIPYELGLLSISDKEMSISEREDDLPMPRVLFGANTNLPYTALSSTSPNLEKINGVDKPSLHMTAEYVDFWTSLRWGRTFFLHNNTIDYMKDLHYKHKSDPILTDKTSQLQLNAKILFGLYHSIVVIYPQLLTLIFDGRVSSLLECRSRLHSFIHQAMNDIHACTQYSLPQESIELSLIKYDSFGQVYARFDDLASLTKDNYLYSFRIQLHHVKNGNDEDLGSILYCDSLTLIDSRFFILTKSIPHYMGWFLSHKHHPSMDFNPEKVHFLKIKAIKKKIETYEGAWGFIPFSTQAIPQPEIPINAKLNLHEYGLVIIDKALGNIIIPFQHIDQFHLYVGSGIFFGIKVKEKNILPFTYLNVDLIVIKPPVKFVSEKYFDFLEMLAEQKVNVLKHDDLPDFIQKSDTYLKNQERVNENLKEILMYLTPLAKKEKNLQSIVEFKKLQDFSFMKNKKFISLKEYLTLKNYTPEPVPLDICESVPPAKEKPGEEGKQEESIEKEEKKIYGVYLMSGIPGSNKTVTAESFVRYANENFNWKILKIEEDKSLELNFDFILALLESSRASSPQFRNLILILNSYHSLKAVLNLFKQSRDFQENYKLKGVINKINAKNYYRNKNLNVYPYIHENSVKGIANAVILERNWVDDKVYDHIMKVIQELNPNVISTRIGKLDKSTFPQLAKILSSFNNRISKLHSAYSYSFLQEGKSHYYSDKNVESGIFKIKMPVQQALLKKNIPKMINETFEDENYEILLHKDEKKAKLEEEEKKEKSKKKTIDELLVQVEIDQEKFLIEEMKKTKQKTEGKNMRIERFKGKLIEEDKKENKLIDIICSFNDLQMKTAGEESKSGLNEKDLNVYMYGNNISTHALNKFFLTCRTQLRKKKDSRTKESLTKEEIEQIEKANVGEFMPEGIHHDGTSYFDDEGNRFFKHPNLELLLDRYLTIQNEDIAKHNEDVIAECEIFCTKYIY